MALDANDTAGSAGIYFQMQGTSKMALYWSSDQLNIYNYATTAGIWSIDDSGNVLQDGDLLFDIDGAFVGYSGGIGLTFDNAGGEIDAGATDLRTTGDYYGNRLFSTGTAYVRAIFEGTTASDSSMVVWRTDYGGNDFYILAYGSGNAQAGHAALKNIRGDILFYPTNGAGGSTLAVTIHGSTYHFSAPYGVHVGGTADPGDDNLWVDGSAHIGSGAAADTVLEVTGAHTSGIGMFHLDGTAQAMMALDAGGSNITGFYFQRDAVSGVTMWVTTGDQLRVGDGSFNGWAYVDDNTGWQAVSTREVKHMFALPDADALCDTLFNTTVYEYERKGKPGRKEIGVVAEEAPHWMQGSDEHSISYLRSIGFLTAVVKRQEERIRELERRITA
jgi:hypothetical protein